MAAVMSSSESLISVGLSASSPNVSRASRALNYGRDSSPIRRTGLAVGGRSPRSQSRDWSPCRRAIDRAGGLGWSPQRRSSTPTRPAALNRDWSPARRAGSASSSPCRSPRSKAEAFASLKRTPDQMVKQADKLIERTQAIMERSAEAKRRTEERLKASKERRAHERRLELSEGIGHLDQPEGVRPLDQIEGIRPLDQTLGVRPLDQTQGDKLKYGDGAGLWVDSNGNCENGHYEEQSAVRVNEAMSTSEG